MLKQTAAVMAAAVLLTVGWVNSAAAEDVLSKVARTGVLTLGANTDRVPYAYFETDGAPPVGYSIDIANLVKDTLEDYLNEELTLEILEVGTFGERIALLDDEQIDLSCDVVFTWERDQESWASTAMSFISRLTSCLRLGRSGR